MSSTFTPKSIPQLTDADLEAQARPIGTPGNPYPIMRGGKLKSIQSADKPMVFYSPHLDFFQTHGILMREMPLPSMLPILEEVARKAGPDSKDRTIVILGEPGDGKSYLAKMLGRILHPEGAIVVDCGGKNLNDNLYEMALDLNSSRGFIHELDKRLAEGKLHPHSIDLLQKDLGSGFIREGKTGHIDWEVIRTGHQEYPDFANLAKTKWPSNDERVMRAKNVLKEISHLEGLENLGGNALGLTSQEGPDIRADRAKRPILWDEVTKSKEGGDDMLAIYLQFRNGEVDEYTAENRFKEKGSASGNSYTFRRSEQGLGSVLIMTGNLSEDGVSTRELSKSWSSRLTPIYLTEKTVEDWQHRICQCLTGVPVSTLYNMEKDHWDKNPDAFTQYLLHVRTEGLSEEQRKNIPSFQMEALTDWRRVLEGSEKFARSAHTIRQMLNPDSDLVRNGGAQFGDLMNEVDPVYAGQMAMDLRKVVQFTGKAMSQRPRAVDASESRGVDLASLDKAPVLRGGRVKNEDPGLNYGTRFVEYYTEWLEQSTRGRGKPALWSHIEQTLKTEGIIRVELTEGQRSDVKTLAELWNFNPYRGGTLEKQAKLVRDMLCKEIKARDPRITAANDEIISVKHVASVMEMAELGEGVAHDAHQNVILIPNGDCESFGAEPFKTILTQDAIRSDGSIAAPVPASELIERDILLLTLAMPRIGDYNLEAMWTRALSYSGITVQPTDLVPDKSVAIAEAHPMTPFVLTTVMTRAGSDSKAVAEPLHILHDTERNRTLIVGNAIPAALGDTLAHRDISYVDRNSKTAVRDIEATIQKFLGKKNTDMYEMLRRAYLMRNMEETDKIGDVTKLPLGELMTSPAMAVKAPHYLTNRPESMESDMPVRAAANNNFFPSSHPRLTA